MATTKLNLPEKQVDQGWCSEDRKRKILNEVVQRYGCENKFVKADVSPLYETSLKKVYRVTLWVNDWLQGSYGPVKVIWRTFFVVLRGPTIHIDEGKKNKFKV